MWKEMVVVCLKEYAINASGSKMKGKAIPVTGHEGP
jgi:hypothetical protein